MVRIPIVERRRRLIDAAIAIIAESGVCGATTRAIVGRAGMPLASFHYVFQSHQELLVATLHALIEVEMREHRNQPWPGSTEEEVIEAALNGQITDVLERSTNYRSLIELCQHVQHIAALSQLPQQFRTRRLERTLERLNDCNERGVVFDRQLPEVAEYLVTATDGISLSLLYGADPQQMRAAFATPLRVS